MTLVEFLRARYDEEEHLAQCGDQRSPDMGLRLDDDLYWVSVTPARVLADVESKRRITAEHTTSEAGEFEGKSYTLMWCPTCRSDGECPTLRLLALPYAKHPDFLPEWAFPVAGDATTYPPPPQVPDR